MACEEEGELFSQRLSPVYSSGENSKIIYCKGAYSVVLREMTRPK